MEVAWSHPGKMCGRRCVSPGLNLTGKNGIPREPERSTSEVGYPCNRLLRQENSFINTRAKAGSLGRRLKFNTLKFQGSLEILDTKAWERQTRIPGNLRTKEIQFYLAFKNGKIPKCLQILRKGLLNWEKLRILGRIKKPFSFLRANERENMPIWTTKNLVQNEACLSSSRAHMCLRGHCCPLHYLSFVLITFYHIR